MKKISVRELQHNLSDYLDIAQTIPITITKYGKQKALIINPDEYDISKKSPKSVSKNILNSPFIGMYHQKKSWAKKSSVELADELKENAWYGK